MEKKLSSPVKIVSGKNIGKLIEIITAAIFYVCLSISIILALGNIFYIRLYPFASKELLLSFEIIILMIMLYLANQQHIRKSIYRILWILAMTKIFFMILMSPNMQKVISFEDCDDIQYCKSFIHSDINQTNCLNSNGAWNIDDNACDYRYNLNGNCEKREGNWIYPNICNAKY
ncbi:MAG: hypothetical protein J6Y53_02750 [Alphaproteobacteria bacterium]|nr:hypothetical protein [Alphaproteobacteria bacterium]